MSIVNNLFRQHKGLSSFLFVFIFLYSGIIRGIITSDNENFVPNYAHHDSATKLNFSSHLYHFKNLSIVNQHKEKSESETDEVHFNFGTSFGSHAPFLFLPYLKFITLNELSWIDDFKLPLYDMFCIWKFHLI